jgi:hypothetical protein
MIDLRYGPHKRRGPCCFRSHRWCSYSFLDSKYFTYSLYGASTDIERSVPSLTSNSVIDDDGPHALAFPCRRILCGWIKAGTKDLI